MNPPEPAPKFPGADSRIVLAERDRFLARDIQRLSGATLNRCGGDGPAAAPGGAGTAPAPRQALTTWRRKYW